MALDATLKTALEGAAPTTFTAISIAINGGATIRLVSGGIVTIGADAYAQEDATYGILGDVETISDGVDGQASRATITMLPPSTAAIAALAAAAAQGSAVYIYQGAITPSTGASIGTVETLFRGELDYSKLVVSEAGYVLVIECGTEELRLLERNEEWTLSDALHQSCFSGELGLSFVTRLPRKIWWRVVDPATTAIKTRVFSRPIYEVRTG